MLWLRPCGGQGAGLRQHSEQHICSLGRSDNVDLNSLRNDSSSLQILEPNIDGGAGGGGLGADEVDVGVALIVREAVWAGVGANINPLIGNVAGGPPIDVDVVGAAGVVEVVAGQVGILHVFVDLLVDGGLEVDEGVHLFKMEFVLKYFNN